MRGRNQGLACLFPLVTPQSDRGMRPIEGVCVGGGGGQRGMGLGRVPKGMVASCVWGFFLFVFSS